ncbi:MAG: hypothetical protein U0457_02015 [Candidatus Sericytochromatia bacterium]
MNTVNKNGKPAYPNATKHNDASDKKDLDFHQENKENINYITRQLKESVKGKVEGSNDYRDAVINVINKMRDELLNGTFNKR